MIEDPAASSELSLREASRKAPSKSLNPNYLFLPAIIRPITGGLLEQVPCGIFMIAPRNPEVCSRVSVPPTTGQ
jgi:hypothetical protein